MEKEGKMKFIDFEEVLDREFGQVGTARRDEFEHSVAEAVRVHELGEAIRKARTQQRLTQQQLGEKIGVRKAQISKLENGHGISLTTMSRIFRALGFPTASLDLGAGGKVPLW